MPRDFTELFPRPSAKKARAPIIEDACATASERELARDVCSIQTVRGLGALGSLQDQWRQSRWSEVDPCHVRELPDCPCVGEDDVEPIGGCIAGVTPEGWSPSYHDNWCAQVAGGMAGKDYCPGTPRPPVPDCLSPQQEEFVSYCQSQGFGGPNPLYNAFCWGAIKSGVFGQMASRPSCGASPPSRPPPQAPPPSGEDEVEEPDEEGKTQRTSMMLPGLILLLVAGGGAAYYFAQRKR